MRLGVNGHGGRKLFGANEAPRHKRKVTGSTMLAQASTQPERGTFGFLKYLCLQSSKHRNFYQDLKTETGYGFRCLEYYNNVTVQFCDDHTVMSITKFSFTYRQTIML